jgi:hypothetical protein
MRHDEARAGRPPNRGRGRRPIKHAFRLRAALSDSYGSRRCRLLGLRGSSRGDRLNHFSYCWDARHCYQPLSHAIMRAMAAAP